MTVMNIDTSEEATDEIAYYVAKDLYGNAVEAASPGLCLEVRKIVLVVAMLQKRSEVPKEDELYPEKS